RLSVLHQFADNFFKRKAVLFQKFVHDPLHLPGIQVVQQLLFIIRSFFLHGLFRRPYERDAQKGSAKLKKEKEKNGSHPRNPWIISSSVSRTGMAMAIMDSLQKISI